MRCLQRTIFHLAWCVALTVWLGVLFLWVRSYWRGDSILLVGQPRSWLLLSGAGGACVALNHEPNPLPLSITVSPWVPTDTPRYPQPGMWAKSITLTNLSFSTGLSGGGASPRAIMTGSISYGASISVSTLTINSSAAAPPIVKGSLVVGQPSQSAGSAPAASGGTSIQVSGGPGNLRPVSPIWGLTTGHLPQPAGASLFGQTRLMGYRVTNPGPTPARTWVLIFPYWLVAIIFGVPVALSLLGQYRQRRRRRWARLGCCSACGYDLRATPDRCPECGAVNEHVTSAGPATASVM